LQINVINVSIEDKGKYQMAEVVYKDDRLETKTKKLMSFTNPSTYATLKNAKNGEAYEITQIKNDKGFWDWTSATKADAAAAATGAKSFTPTKSSYETTEERARRQVLIVKQSSLSAAIAHLNARADKDEYDISDVKAIAQELADWVLADEQVAVEEAQ
jgi:ABC-type phosphate transport system substrate-binding protein